MSGIPMGPAGIAVVWDRMQAAEYKLHQLERIASSADWQGRTATPQLFAMFCNELLQVIDIDAVDGITGAP